MSEIVEEILQVINEGRALVHERKFTEAEALFDLAEKMWNRNLEFGIGF